MTWTRHPAVDDAEMRRRHPFAALVRREVGLIEGVSYLPSEPGAVDLAVAATRLDNVTYALPGVSRGDGADLLGETLGGGGADIDPEQSWIQAVVEAAERYSTMVFTPQDFVVASATELGARALDLTAIPRCSAAEYADPACPLRPPTLDDPIRWVRGLSLLDRRERFVPAVMAHLFVKPWPAERFWLPISTGVAAHTRLDAAVIAAICENIERDALALAWLLRRELPQIDEPDPPDDLAPLLRRLAASSTRHLAFDATTDYGVPTVLAIQLADGDPNCDVLVSCASAIDPRRAYAKTIREACAARVALRHAPPAPANIVDFADITHGASYYGHGGHRDAFDFLLSGSDRTTLRAMATRSGLDPGAEESDQLGALVDRLAGQGMDPVIIDLTAEEVREVGLWVVRVVLPELVPISFVHRARYLGTPRLLTHADRHAAASAGAGTEGPLDGINPDPLPFA